MQDFIGQEINLENTPHKHGSFAEIAHENRALLPKHGSRANITCTAMTDSMSQEINSKKTPDKHGSFARKKSYRQGFFATTWFLSQPRMHSDARLHQLRDQFRKGTIQTWLICQKRAYT